MTYVSSFFAANSASLSPPACVALERDQAPPEETHHPNYESRCSAPLPFKTVKELKEVFSSFILSVTHSTERNLPENTDYEDASSGDHSRD
ncbi:hypothetical protein J6590_065368 [Homalodisca vitripennis]|nr:hypothetical protein J6590_065368 [Homalodisca vitripennis]